MPRLGLRVLYDLAKAVDGVERGCWTSVEGTAAVYNTSIRRFPEYKTL